MPRNDQFVSKALEEQQYSEFQVHKFCHLVKN